MAALKWSLFAVCLILVLDLYHLIRLLFPHWDPRLVCIGLVICVLPCIVFNSIFSVFYIYFLFLLLVFQAIFYFLNRSPSLFQIICPLFFTIGCLAYGSFRLHNLEATTYTLKSDKVGEDLKIGILSDLHYPTALQEKDVLEMVKALKEEKCDFYVLCGDIVDEFTTKQEMEVVFQQLGRLSEIAPVYYVFGNHDNQHYSDAPAFTKEELAEYIENSSIQVLQDEVLKFQDIQIIARDDKEVETRKTLSDLKKETDEDKFTIVVDHQPVDLEQCRELGIDLQLSGHTHAGQIFPLGYFQEFLGFVEHNYGMLKNGNFTQITTSGAHGWGMPVRTQGKSEYVIVNVQAS